MSEPAYYIILKFILDGFNLKKYITSMGVFMQKRFMNDYADILQEQRNVEALRMQPVTAATLTDKQPVSVLASLIKMWPTHDLRYEVQGGHLEDALMTDMMKSMFLKIIRTDISTGMVEGMVEFISNLDQIERYNTAVQHHNKEWINQGSPVTDFDPVHGEISRVKDNFVDPVYLQGTNYSLPPSVYRDSSSGSLACAKPKMLRRSYVRLKYQMSILDTLFVLGYAVYDSQDQIIYYNEVSHHDLAYLVRRSVQEIWGNHTVKGQYPKRLLDGISYLLNGDKIPICKRDNKFPEFIRSEDTKVKSTKTIRRMEEDISTLKIAISSSAYVAPLFCILGFIGCFIWMAYLVASDDFNLLMGDQIYRGGIQSIFYLVVEVILKPPMMGCILLLILTIFFRKLSQQTERKVSELTAQKKFI
jgi:hypothetical protein